MECVGLQVHCDSDYFPHPALHFPSYPKGEKTSKDVGAQKH